jgi:hypothetical protein
VIQVLGGCQQQHHPYYWLKQLVVASSSMCMPLMQFCDQKEDNKLEWGYKCLHDEDWSWYLFGATE